MSNYTGGPAFPHEERGGDGMPIKDHFGMTLRDYFAAKAMQSLIVHYGSQGIGLASLSYEMADAMLAEREKGQ